MTAPWLTLLGVGDDGPGGLRPAARALLDTAEVVIGGDRHLAHLPEAGGRTKLAWPSPMTGGLDAVLARRGQNVCVLASGDPLWCGAGAWLRRHLPAEEMRVIPHVSAFQLAAARLGWPLAETRTRSLHGRPVATVVPALHPGAKLLLLGDGGTARELAELLTRRGFGGSRLWVLAHLDGADERVETALARAWTVETPALTTVAVHVAADAGAAVVPETPGLPDTAFRHDGQLTKREVRAVTLAALQPMPGQHLWDVGAGTGSVAIEWLRGAARTSAVAVEHRADRAGLAAENASALGVPDLQVRTQSAPDALDTLAAPDAVFLGGGVTDGTLDPAWRALRPGGRLVANTVTVEGEQALLAWQAAHGGELVRLTVEHLEPLGGYRGWRAQRPVTQLRAVKAGAGA